ncbi:MAG: hypothetical protein JWO76_1604 [Nocardioides sp.]|nr:hypothetical protein [Nocardioides sp.]
MTPVFAARRRADEFAALVEGTSTGGPDVRFADLLELVGALREAPAVGPRPEFVTDLRERLLLAAEADLVPSRAATETARLTLPPRHSKRDRRIAAAVGGIALVGATTSMAMAAQSALPGDVLYPIKRVIENAQTGVAVGEGQKGETLLANAAGRLDEVSELSRSRGAGDSLAIADTLNDFTEQATEASDLLLSDFAQSGHESSIADLRDFTASSLDQLTSLAPAVPSEARDELLHAAHVLLQIDAAAEQACPACGGAGIAEIPPAFAPVASSVPGTVGSSTPAQPTGKHHQGPKGQSTDPQVPQVNSGALPPGSVLTAPDSGGSTTGGDDPAPSDPIGTLTDGLTGGGSSQPTSNPSLPDLGGVIDDAGDAVDDVTDPLAP